MLKTGLAWGLQIPETNVKQIYGARAIYDGKTLDFVGDRQAYEKENDTSESIFNWINKTFVPALLKKRYQTNSNETFTLSERNFTGIASPNGSYGYMYITCYES